jgi:lysophospholipase L1-like esterase
MNKSIQKYFYLLLFVVALWSRALPAQTKANATDVSRWENEISAFEARDKTDAPPRGAILFVGSSSIRKWTTLAKDFPGKQVINRGFGGSEIADSTALADRIIFPYAPRMIVLYAGDNDLAAGKSADKVFADFQAFLKKIHERLPETTVAFISIKPCPLRWRLKDKVVEVNQRIAAIKDDKLIFIDVYPSMLGADGKPRPELFVADGLHPSAKCYQLWAKLITPYLK